MTMIALFSLALLAGLIFFLIMLQQPQPFEKAIKYMQAKNHIMAIDIFNRLIAKQPEDYRAHFYLARCYESLNLFSDALAHFSVVRANGIFNDEISALEVYHKIADFQLRLGQAEDAFETSLELLSLYGDDSEGNARIALMAIGQKRFDIAQPYIDKSLRLAPDNRQLQLAAMVTYYYLGKKDRSYEIIDQLLAADPADFDLQFYYVTMADSARYQEAAHKITDLFRRVETHQTRQTLFEIFLHNALAQNRPDQVVSFIEKRVDYPDLDHELRRYLYYYYILMLLKGENYNLAEKALNDLYEKENSLASVNELIPFVRARSIVTAQSADSFDEIYRQRTENILPDDLLFNISGLRSNDSIYFEKFFESSENGQPVLKDLFSQSSSDNLLERYSQLTAAELKRFAQKAILLLGYKPAQKLLPSPQNDGLDAIVEKQYGQGEKYLVCFRRLPENASIADIYISNLAGQVSEGSFKKAVLVTNASLSAGAQEKTRSLPTVSVLPASRLAEILRSALPR